MLLRRSGGQLQKLQSLLTEGGGLRQIANATEQTEGLVPQALTIPQRSIHTSYRQSAAKQLALQPERTFPQLARFSSQSGWQYGSTVQPWGGPSYHSFHCFSNSQSPTQYDDDESLRWRQVGSGGRMQERGLRTSAYSFAAVDPTRQPAEQCDDVIGALQKTRSQYVRAQAPYGNITYAKQLQIWAKAGVCVMKKVGSFMVSVPGRVVSFTRLTSAERSDIYQGLWNSAKEEARHYWAGTKLLWADIKIATRLVSKVVKGKTLTRRERKQLTRTVADIFRLVPVAVFLLVPFMELLLPVALKLFPNMLPSTFEDKLKKEEELKKSLNIKLEVAKFLQDTVADMAKDMRKNKTGAAQASAAELYDFMKKVRAGEPVDNDELVKFAQLFNDELTLDNLERIHLVNLCRFVGITPFGTDEFLRSRLRSQLAAIKADDRAIKAEGLDSLTETELREACRARGMKGNVYGEGAGAVCRKKLEQWLDLSLNRALPSSLLLLSRAFTMTQPQDGRKKKLDVQMESLKDTLGTLNKEVLEGVGVEVGDIGGLAHQYEQKLVQLKREEELIREEHLLSSKEELLDDPASQTGVTRSESTPQLAAQAAAGAVMREAAASAIIDALQGESAEEKASKMAGAREEKMRKVLSALAVLASSSGVAAERGTFLQLVQEEINRVNKQMAGRSSTNMTFQRGGINVERPGELQEVVGHQRLQDNVSSILQRIERELDHVDSRIGESMHILDLDNDGLISKSELQTAMGFLSEQLGEDELRHLLERLNAFSDDTARFSVNGLMDLAAAENSPATGISP